MCLEAVSQASGIELKWCKTLECTEMSSKTSSNIWNGAYLCLESVGEKVKKWLERVSVCCQKMQNCLFLLHTTPSYHSGKAYFLLIYSFLLAPLLYCDGSSFPFYSTDWWLTKFAGASLSGLRASQSSVSLHRIGISQIPTLTTVCCFCQINTTVLVALWKPCM